MSNSIAIRCNKCESQMNIVGQGKVSAVFKCPKCGDSVTAYTDSND